MTTRQLNVWWDGGLVGQFRQDRHGDISFAYVRSWLDDNNARPLSVSLPKRPEPFSLHSLASLLTSPFHFSLYFYIFHKDRIEAVKFKSGS